MEIILCFYVSITVLFVLTMVIYVWTMRDKHRKRKIKDKEQLKKMTDDVATQLTLETLIDRRYSHRCNYIGFQLVDKVFGIAGIIYSLMGIMTIVIESSRLVEFLIDFTAVICVIIAIYLTPRNRIAEYDRSAKKLDSDVQEAFSMISKYKPDDALNKNLLVELNSFVGKAIEEAENEIISDEQ